MYKKRASIVINTLLSLLLTQICCAHEPITIMTAPLGHNGWGHRQVTESLLHGLTQLGVPFVYNPASIDQVTDTVVVLADPHVLQQAIALKKMGRIKHLLAGPNIMVRADEYGGILAYPEVDVCIVPSPWVATAYEEEMPSLKGRIKCWYAGVDTVRWHPVSDNKSAIASKNVLVYWKTEHESFVAEVEAVVRACGFNPIRLRYGHYAPEQYNYTPDQYKMILNDVACAIFISRSESQGLALAEAWSMNVPTLVWDPGELHAHGRIYSTVSACPYLTQSTGCTWQQITELKNILENLPQYMFAPRQWVLDCMTDRASAHMLCTIVDELLTAHTPVAYQQTEILQV